MGGNSPAPKTADPATETYAAAEDSPSTAAAGKRSSGDRAGFIAGVAVLAACAALVLYGVLHTGSSAGTAHHHTPTAPVTYEVTGTGTADLTYQARSTSGRATVVHAAHLPWRTTVDVPLGEKPLISIVLDPKGGQAHCSLAIHGKHAQSATATGPYGRATCTATLPKGSSQ